MDTPPPVHHAANAVKKPAKGIAGLIKGKPTWVYIAGITVLIGVAYLTFKSKSDPAANEADQQDALANDTLATPDGPEAYGDLGGGVVTAAPTQGAYGGFSDPGQAGQAPMPDATDPGNAGTVVNIYGARAFDEEAIPTESGPVTGGGMPRRPSTASKRPPKKKHKPVHHPAPKRHKPKAKKKPSRVSLPKRKPRRKPAAHHRPAQQPAHRAPAHHKRHR